MILPGNDNSVNGDMDPVTDDEAPAASDNEALPDDYKEDHPEAALGFFCHYTVKFLLNNE